jgi:glycine betaine/proline transport system substrate-binding protein
VARTGFYLNNVEAASFFSRVQIPVDDLQKAMYDAQETSYAEAVTNYIDQNPDRINYWISGEL